ncbi:MAG TPA: glycosyltransferase [Terriglobia bacterium]|nr:glycosyltransferase [Terriglobia bacterium]
MTAGATSRLHPDLGAAENSEVCAAIVTYRIGPRIADCVNSVAGQVGGVVIVDNGSDGPTLEALHDLESRSGIRVIYNSRNLGIAHALNQAVRWARRQGFQWVLTLDHDSEASAGMVGKLLRVYKELGGQAGIVAANPFDRNARVLQRPGADSSPGYFLASDPVISSGSLIVLSVFDRAGLFAEPLFLYYVDHEFCLRLRRCRFQIAVCRDAILLHSEGNKVSRRFLWRRVFYDQYGREARYYVARNSIFMLKNYPREMRYGYLVARRTCTDLLKVILYDEHPWPKVRYMLKGFRDGIAGRYGSLESPQHVR